jgi:zinc transport system permease protein
MKGGTELKIFEQSFNETIAEFSKYFSFPFVQRAMIVGVLIAFCSSLLGVTLVMKRLSFIGSGLSHVSFCTSTVVAALAMAIGLENFQNNLFYVLPVTILCAVVLMLAGPNSKLKGDSALAMISVGSLAMGFLFMNLFPTSANLAGDVCVILFGSSGIITLSRETMWFCVVLTAFVTVVFLLFYNTRGCITRCLRCSPQSP